MPNGPTPRPGYQGRNVGSHLVPERAEPRADTAGGRRGGRLKPNIDVTPKISGPEADMQWNLPDRRVDGLWGRVGDGDPEGGSGQPKVDSMENPTPGDNIQGSSKPLGAGNTIPEVK